MPILLNFLEKNVFFNLNLGPGPVMDIWSGVGFRVVLAAIRLGVFEALADGPLTPDALARKIEADPRGAALLLSALEALGYVRQQDGAFANTAMTTKWMLRRSANFGPGFEFWANNLFALMGNLEDSLRTGQPPLNLYTWIEGQPETSRAFQEWMIAIAGFAADIIVGLTARHVPAGARRLLDIGGGHARYAMAFCCRHPDLTATVFDSPRALEAARTSIAAENMAERITAQEGNFLTDSLGEGYDVALMFNINHGFSAEQNQALLRNTARALRPGGRLFIAEQLAGRAPSPAANATKALLGLSYFHLLGGQLCAYEDVARWLTTAGFGGLRRIDSLRLPGTSIAARLVCHAHLNWPAAKGVQPPAQSAGRPAFFRPHGERIGAPARRAGQGRGHSGKRDHHLAGGRRP